MNPKFNLLVWDCKSECEYQCMWSTVKRFQSNNYPIPQFHGKVCVIIAHGCEIDTDQSVTPCITHYWGESKHTF